MQFEHAILATGSRAGDSADAEGRRSARDGLDRGARSARHPEVAAGRRRRLHRPRARHVYAALGSAVTVVEMTPGLLPGADRDLVDVLAKRVAQTMKSVLLETKVVKMKPEAEGHPRHVRGRRPIRRSSCSIACWSPSAAGRTRRFPGSSGRTCRSISAASSWSTSSGAPHEPSIFAIGDVVGEPMLAHKASHEGRVAVEVMAGENVGVRAARDSGGGLHRSGARVGRPDRGAGRRRRTARSTVAKFPWGASGRAITLDRTDGLTKLILDPETERAARRRPGRPRRRRADRRRRAGDRDGRATRPT